MDSSNRNHRRRRKPNSAWARWRITSHASARPSRWSCRRTTRNTMLWFRFTHSRGCGPRRGTSPQPCRLALTPYSCPCRCEVKTPLAEGLPCRREGEDARMRWDEKATRVIDQHSLPRRIGIWSLRSRSFIWKLSALNAVCCIDVSHGSGPGQCQARGRVEIIE